MSKVKPNSLEACGLLFDPNYTNRRAKLHMGRLPAPPPTEEVTNLTKIGIAILKAAMLECWGTYETYSLLAMARYSK